MKLFLSYTQKCLQCINTSLKNIITHDGVEHAGYLSYITLLSIFPFLVWFTALASMLPAMENHQTIESFLNSMIEQIPENIMSGLNPRIHEIISGPPVNLLTLATIGMLWSSSSIIEGLRTIFNKAYGVYSPPHYLFRRVLSILQFIAITFFMILFMSSVKLFSLPNEHEILGLFHKIINGGALFFCIVTIHMVIPNKKQSLIDVLPGALLTTLLWRLATTLYVRYLETFHQLSIIYGSLAGIIASMIFFYIINLIMIYGAELNHSIVMHKQLPEENEIKISHLSER